MQKRNKKDDLEEEQLFETLHATVMEVVSCAVKQSLDIREALFNLNSFYKSRCKNLEAVVVVERETDVLESAKVGLAIVRKKGKSTSSVRKVKSFQQVATRKSLDDKDKEFLKSCNISPN